MLQSWFCPFSTQDEEDENLKFEALHERRIQLAGFCKLVVYNLLPIKSAAPLYRHYIRFHGEFGDIMKSTLGKLREINRVHTAKMIVYCLQLGFNELQAACQVCHVCFSKLVGLYSCMSYRSLLWLASVI